MASNKVKLGNLSKGSKSARRALRLLQRPDVLLASILIGNNFANILASAIVTIIMIVVIITIAAARKGGQQSRKQCLHQSIHGHLGQ